MSRSEAAFADEYVSRCTDLREVLAARCREIEDFERVVRELRAENFNLRTRLERAERARVVPEEIAVTVSRGERYHLPTCGNVRRTNFRTYTPCQACLNRGG